MPVINIKEVDYTAYTPPVAPTDNVVYVPGTAITGPSEPTLCASYEEFVNTFGTKPASSSSYGNTWEYAANLVKAGFPVLYQRMVETDVPNPDPNAEEGSTICAETAHKELADELTNYDVEVTSFPEEYIADVQIDVDTLRSDFSTELQNEEYTAVYTDTHVDADINIGENITDVAVVASTFAEKYSETVGLGLEDGTQFIMVFDGTDWTVGDVPSGLTGQTITPAELGITITGTPVQDDRIILTYVVEKWIVTFNAGTPDEYTVDITNALTVTVITGQTIPAQSEIKFNGIVTNYTVKYAEVAAKYPGSFGNTLSLNFYDNDTYLYAIVLKDGMEVETVRICRSSKSATERYDAFVAALEDGTLKTSYTVFSIVPEAFNVSRFSELFLMGAIKLEGGTDIFDEDIIPTLVAASTDSKFDIFSTKTVIADKFMYDIKYLTTGGLNLPRADMSVDDNIYKRMVRLAEYRGECLAVLDAEYTVDALDMVQPTEGTTYFTDFLGNANSSYATAFAPWFYMSLSTDTAGKWMAPSYVFLHQLANSVSSGNPSWQTPAGVNRGTVAEAIKPAFEIGSAILDSWQNTGVQFINPIMKLRNYGYVIFGNRTLYKNVESALGSRSALQELAVRMVADDVKKAIINVAISLTFEANTYHTWLAFQAALDPTLADMKVRGGLIDYEIIMDETTTTASDIEENRVNGIVRVNIARAAENFEIGFELAAAGVTFTAEEL